jgi:hypothetical protein
MTTGRVSRRLVAAAVTVAFLAAVPVATHAATPTSLMTLGQTTTITGRGTASLVLNVPRLVTMPTNDFRLYLSGGTYAVARLEPLYQPRGCSSVHPPLGGNCVFWEFEFLRATVATFFPSTPVGQQNFGFVPDPSYVWAGPMKVQILTDGAATFVFHAADAKLPTSVRYAPAPGHFGRAAILPTRCPENLCASGVDIRAAGQSYDLGKSGYVEYLAISESAQSGVNMAAGCIYPNPDDPTASGKAADHPFGCDDVSTRPGGDEESAGRNLAMANEVAMGPAVGNSFSEWTDTAHGLTYVGEVTRAAASPPPTSLFFAIWLNDPPPLRVN